MLCRGWVKDEQTCWELKDIDPENVVADGDVHWFDPTHAQDLQDVSDMNNIHEGPLLNLLKRRYMKKQIYTFSGDILISINPYARVDHLYEAKQVVMDGAPHVYTVADRALMSLKENPDIEQTIIINGESGAGKTEASKYAIRYLSENGADSGGSDPLLDTIQEKLIDSNLLLEAFGNAQTMRNNNSSRFGKYVRIEFDRENDFKVAGAQISYFLLETSRLVSRPSKYEQNYHVFYALCHGSTPEERERYKISDSTTYRYLGETSQSTLGDAQATWEGLKHTFDHVLGLSEEQVDQILFILSAILNLGNVQVKELEQVTSMANPSAKENGDDANCAENIRVAGIDKGQESLINVAEILGVDVENLATCLTSRLAVTNSARLSVQRVALSQAQSQDAIDGLVKALYQRLFDFIVTQINSSMNSSKEEEDDDKEEEADREKSSSTLTTMTSKIGLLDIYGFEIMTQNSLEQLCINYANEKLQRQFNAKVFEAEQARYLSEGVNWSMQAFGKDNQPCLDLIESSRLGVMSIIDEQTLMFYHACGVASAEDQDSKKLIETQLLQKLHKAHGGNKHTHYIKPRIAGTSFIIKHFAGNVEYSVVGFPKKNMDALHADLVTMIQGSSNSFLHELMQKDIMKVKMEHEMRQASANRKNFTPNKARNMDNELNQKWLKKELTMVDKNLFAYEKLEKTNSGKQRNGGSFAAKATIACQFKQQLNRLMEILDAGQPHYIRCIKPNMDKAPFEFDSPLVLEQLRYVGILETVRIRKVGFPVRIKLDDFENRYKTLLTAEGSIEAALNKYLGDDSKFQTGKTAVFLKDHQNEVLDRAVRALEKSRATKIQAFIRTKKEREVFKKRKATTTKMQALIRGHLARKEMQHHEKCAAMIQRNFRKYTIRKYIKATRIVVAFARMVLRKLALAKNAAATKIQSHCRVVRPYRYLQKARKAALRIQLAFRSMMRIRLLASRMERLHKSFFEEEEGTESFAKVCELACKEQWNLEGVRFHRQNGKTLLHSAAEAGNLAAVEFLLDSTSDGAKLCAVGILDALDYKGNNVLHSAASCSNPDKRTAICRAVLNKMIDELVVVDSTEINNDHSSSSTREPQDLKEVLFKRRVKAKFKRRFVHLDTKNKTIQYFKNARDKKPRKSVKLDNQDTGVMLKVSEKYTNTFEIHSPELLSAKSQHGCIYFRCKNQKDMQRWISTVRAIDGVGFTSAVSGLDRINLVSWNKVATVLLKENKQKQNPFHVAAQADHADTALWFAALVSSRGPIVSLGLLESVSDFTNAEQSPTTYEAIKKLKGTLHSNKGDTPRHRRSISPHTLMSSAKSGGIYLSLFMDHLIDAPIGSHIAISVLNSPTTLTEQFTENDFVEPQVVFHPVLLQDKKQHFGGMWHMQTPLEQLPPTAGVLIQLKMGSKIIHSINIPFNTNTIGNDNLAPGNQTFAIPKQQIIKKRPFLFQMRSTGHLNIVQEESQEEGSSVIPQLASTVYYSMRSEPCTNCCITKSAK